jgi:hypothetical protein
VNTGNVALTTGLVSFHDITLSPGNVQRNIILNTSQGQIVIGPNGLSGAILDLELIAKQITVNGPVLNTVSNSAARIRTVAGGSQSEIDGSVSPTDLISTWIGHTASGSSNPGATALDITALGSLTAGRVELVITEQGAGVRHAGAIYANVGDFTIAGNGDLHIAGGRIQAANDVVMANANVDSQSADGNVAAIQAGRTIDIRTSGVALADANLTAGQRTIDAGGNVVVSQRGNIIFGTDSVAGTGDFSFNRTVFDATGGIGIYDDARQVRINASQLAAEQDVILKSRNIALTNNSPLLNSSGAASLVSKTGTIALTATDAVQLSGFAVSGAAGVSVNAASLTTSAARDAVGGRVFKSALQSSAADVAVTTSGTASFAGTDVTAAKNVIVQGSSIISANDGNSASRIIAVDGGVLMTSATDITNTGSLIQGSARIAGNGASIGAVTLRALGSFVNQSPSEALLGAVFGLNDDVSIRASADITNRNARLISNTVLSLIAGGNVSNIIDKVAGANGEQGSTYQTSSNRWLLLTERSSGFDVDYGRVVMPNQLAYLVGENGINVQAASFTNQGGIGLVNNGNINIAVSGAFRNEALFDGQAHYQRSCMIFCSSSASSTVASHGGTLTASGNISITAGTEAVNIGGEVLALGDLTVSAPRIYAQGVVGYRAYTQSGMKTWFGSSWARLYATDTGGTWTAGNKLTLNGQGVIDGGSFTGLAELIASNGILTLRTPHRDPVSIEHSLGLGSGLW